VLSKLRLPSPRTARDALGQQVVDLLTLGPAELAPRLAALPPERLDLVLEQATAHSVAPLLRNRLVEQGLFGQLPRLAKASLDAQYLESAARAMARYRELEEILAHLREASIPVIALKGIYLAKAVYAESGLRPMADIDLLFHAQDLGAVQSLLLGLGFSQSGMHHPIEHYVATAHELPGFFRGMTKIEAHLRIERPQSPFRIDHAGIWERAQPWPLGGQPLLAMAAEDLLLHLCIHAMYHHLGRIPLLALVDIARVTERGDIDWERFVDRTASWRAESPVYLGLELSRRLVGADIPRDVTVALRPAAGVESALRMVERTLFNPRQAAREDDGFRLQRARLSGYLKNLSGMQRLPSVGDRLGYLLSRAFPQRPVLERQYPAFKGCGWVRVMYAVHWLVVAGRFLRAAMLHWRYWLTLRTFDRRWFS
jgi:hypothetical protein